LRSEVKGRSPGRSHNEWGFSNRMLDTTVALMAVK
jgi:glyceraldehyde-3-phosphate dehydrogenase/erythrose-4-phosphate dehydrogenase